MFKPMKSQSQKEAEKQKAFDNMKKVWEEQMVKGCQGLVRVGEQYVLIRNQVDYDTLNKNLFGNKVKQEKLPDDFVTKLPAFFCLATMVETQIINPISAKDIRDMYSEIEKLVF